MGRTCARKCTWKGAPSTQLALTNLPLTSHWCSKGAQEKQALPTCALSPLSPSPIPLSVRFLRKRIEFNSTRIYPTSPIMFHIFYGALYLTKLFQIDYFPLILTIILKGRQQVN